MVYIKVPAIDSTNTLLKEMLAADPGVGNTCLAADFQKKGRGQRGASWQGNPGESLMFSILLRNLDLKGAEGFRVSISVGLGILAFLREQEEQLNLKIKWPNDILAGSHKICGILIENKFNRGKIGSTVIGVGLNLNQQQFFDLPHAGSLRMCTGKQYNASDLLPVLAEKLEEAVYKGIQKDWSTLKDQYETELYKKNILTDFILPDGERISGIIKGIDNTGLLRIQFDNEVQTFDIKEIQMDY